MSKQLLICYGTLMHSGLPIKGELTLEGDMYSLDAYPAVTNLDSSNKFYCQVAQVTREDLAILDHYENVQGGLFRREKIDTEYGPAWIYIFNQELPDHAKPIQDWRKETV